MPDEPPAASAYREPATQIVVAYVQRNRTGKISALVGALTTFLVAVLPAQALDNLSIERLALCQDSWLDWKNGNPAQLQKFKADFQANFLHRGNDPFFIPRSSQTVAGLPVVQVFPESVGMGVGFSVMVNTNFDNAKATLERKVGKLLRQCEVGDNMRTCELEIGEKRTLTLAAEDNPKSTTTLRGCYYFYAK